MTPTKTKYKYIFFEQSSLDVESKESTVPAWTCRNIKSNEILGYAYYYHVWKQWVFTQADSSIVFSESCLLDIVNFLQQLNKK